MLEDLGCLRDITVSILVTVPNERECEVRKLIPKDTQFSQKCYEVSYYEGEFVDLYLRLFSALLFFFRT